jgi:hypothetical protein
MQLVVAHEPQLRETWEQHRNADDILVLCDLGRVECQAPCIAQWGEPAVSRAIADAERSGSRAMMAYLQPASFIKALASSGDWAHKETAKELRGMASAASLGVIPLLVIDPAGLWATQWSAPGSKVEVVRYTPAVGPENN